MRFRLILPVLFLAGVLLLAPAPAAAIIDGGPGFSAPATAKTAAVRDYQAVRKAALALSVLGFLLAAATLATSEHPAERDRAQRLLTLTCAVFLVLVADRWLARNVAGWFGFGSDILPVFWQ